MDELSYLTNRQQESLLVFAILCFCLVFSKRYKYIPDLADNIFFHLIPCLKSILWLP